jgi:hypothetical protein
MEKSRGVTSAKRGTAMRRIFRSLWEFFRLFEYSSDNASGEGILRIAKALLDFIRNLAVVSAIAFFAKRSDSLSLTILAEVGKIALALTVGSYIARIHFIGWHGVIEHRKTLHVMTIIYSAIPAFLFYYLFGIFINHAVGDIVRSQLLR